MFNSTKRKEPDTLDGQSGDTSDNIFKRVLAEEKAKRRALTRHRSSSFRSNAHYFQVTSTSSPSASPASLPQSKPKKGIQLPKDEIPQSVKAFEQRRIKYSLTPINYMAGEADYIFFTGGWHSGIAIKGGRSSQQDRLAFARILEAKQLTSEQLTDLMKRCFAKMQQKAIELYREGNKTNGSCATAVYVNKTLDAREYQLTSAWVGDTQASVLVFDREFRVKRLDKLYTELHRAERRLDNNKGTLAVSRAIGDIDYEEQGLVHDADVLNSRLTLAENEDAWLLVNTDGVDEIVLDLFIKKITDNYKKPIPVEYQRPYDFIRALVEFAETNIEDNSSIQCIVLDGMNTNPDGMAFLAIDGHGTSDVIAEMIRVEFTKEFKRLVKELQAGSECRSDRRSDFSLTK